MKSRDELVVLLRGALQAKGVHVEELTVTERDEGTIVVDYVYRPLTPVRFVSERVDLQDDALPAS